MKQLFFAWLLCCVAGAGRAQTGHPVNLDAVATIRFPVLPQVRDTLGQRIYLALHEDQTYMVMSRHLEGQPGFQLGEGELDGFYQGLAKGVVGASQGTIVAQKSFVADGAQGIELTYTNTRNPAFPPRITSRTLYVNGYLFTYQVLPAGEASPAFAAQQAAFFNSFRLVPDAAAKARQYTLDENGQPRQSTAGRVGYLLGKFGFYALLAVLALQLVRRLRRTSSKSSPR